MSVTALPTHARRRLEQLRRYRAGGSTSDPSGKLSSNESPLGPAPQVRTAIMQASEQVNRYPDAHQLLAELAASEGVAPSQVVVTNGSDELCYLIAALFIEDGAPVVLSDPCYQIDELVSRLHRGEPRSVPLRADGGHDLAAMAAAATDAAIVWLPTPHNPTGVPVDADELSRFLDVVPVNCLVVLDEAYRNYLAAELRPATVELIARYPNLISQRTFSKSHGLAGLRIGYGLGSANLIEALTQIKAPFNVGAVALAGARAALQCSDWTDYAVELTCRERARLEAQLTSLGVEHFSSQANFVTARFARRHSVMRALADAGLTVRDGADLGMPEWTRISIGTPAVMSRLRKVLEEVI